MSKVQQIKEIALANYNNGWDYIVECFTDEEIQSEYLNPCGDDLEAALKLIESVAGVRKERQDDAQQYIKENTNMQTTKAYDTASDLMDIHVCPLMRGITVPTHGDFYAAPPLNWIIVSDFDYDNYDDGIPF